MMRRVALLGLVLASCRATPSDPRQDAAPTKRPEPTTGFQPLPSLHRLGSVPGRQEVVAFRYGDLARTIEVDGFGRVVLRDPTAGAAFSVVLSTSTGRPQETFISLDGRWALVEFGNDAVEAWNAESGVRIAEFGPAGWRDAAIAPSRPVAAMLTSGSAKIIDLRSGEASEVEPRPYRVFMAPDGKHAVLGDILWDISAKPQKVRELDGMDSFSALQGFSNDAEHFAYIAARSELRVVNTADGSVELTVRGLANGLGSRPLRWSPSDAHILIEDDGTEVIEVATGKISTDPGTLGALSPSGESAVFMRRGNAAWRRLSDFEVLAIITPASEHGGAVFVDDHPFIADPDGTATVEGARSDEVRLSTDLRPRTRFDARGVLVTDEGDADFGRLEPHVRAPKTDEDKLQTIPAIHAVDFEDDDTLVTYGAMLTRWSIDDGLDLDRSCPLSRLASARQRSRAQVAAYGSAIVTRNEHGHWAHSKSVGCDSPRQRPLDFGIGDHDLSAVSPDATSLFVVIDDAAVDVASEASFEHGADAVRDAAIGPSGDTIALRTYDGVRIARADGSRTVGTGPTSALTWDGRDGRLLVAGSRGLTIIGDTADPQVAQIAGEDLGPDNVDVSRLVLAGDTAAWQIGTRDEARLVIASVESGTVIASIQGPHPFAVSPDGSLVAFAVPGWIRTLDVSSGREVSATRTQLREIERLRFSPSGSRLAAVGYGLEVYELAESGR